LGAEAIDVASISQQSQVKFPLAPATSQHWNVQIYPKCYCQVSVKQWLPLQSWFYLSQGSSSYISCRTSRHYFGYNVWTPQGCACSLMRQSSGVCVTFCSFALPGRKVYVQASGCNTQLKFHPRRQCWEVLRKTISPRYYRMLLF